MEQRHAHGQQIPLAIHRFWCVLAFALIAGGATVQTQQRNTDPERFEPEIRKFEEADRVTPPPAGAVVFTGSSSIRRWDTLAKDFPQVAVLNRGFGGSEASDVVRYADRVILRYKPSRIVFYAGDNDLARGKTPAQVAADVERLADMVREALPEARMAIISIKPSLARWHLVEQMRDANARLKALADKRPELAFIDVFPGMLGPDGKPVPGYYVEDGLHLTDAGYRVWTAALMPFLR
jgi:lysophospholipase L1-like esterase